MIPISVLILTKNEELDLPGCLDSVAWSDDIHVLDSYSTDGTVPVIEASQAHLHQRVFDGYASQRNYGLHEISYRHQWLLVVDADERIPQALAHEMHQAVTEATADVAAFRMRRRDFLHGRWLKHVQASPWFIRLVQPFKVHYEREINEVLIAEGAITNLKEPFDHYPFSKGIAHWIDKHNQYSTMEARELLCKRHLRPSLRHALTTRDFNQRRYHQKAVFYCLPFRPQLRFLFLYLLRLGILDGKPGLLYARLQATYEYFIVLKSQEGPFGQADV